MGRAHLRHGHRQRLARVVFRRWAGRRPAGRRRRRPSRFEAEGADIIDLGGQSTAPGFDELSREELRRVVPALGAVRSATTCRSRSTPTTPRRRGGAGRRRATCSTTSPGFRTTRRWRPGWRADGAALSRCTTSAAASSTTSSATSARASKRRWRSPTRPARRASAHPRPGLRLRLDAAEPRDAAPSGSCGTSACRCSSARRASRRSGRARTAGGPAAAGTAATVALAIANGADIVRVHDVRRWRRSPA